MRKKRLFLLTVSMMLALGGCGFSKEATEGAYEEEIQEEESYEEEFYEETERTIDITLDGYCDAGGQISLTEIDANGDEYTFETDILGLLAAPGETIGDAMDYSDLMPVCGDYTFEGWLEYTETAVTDEDGFETSKREIVSDRLYTTEELLALPVSDHPVWYVAKWDAIPIEEYFVENPLAAYLDSSSSGGFAFGANGGELTFFTNDQNEYTTSGYVYWMEDDQALNDIMGTENGDALISIEKEGAEFDGWTLYEAESLFFTEEKVENEELKCFSFMEAEEYGFYILMRNPVIYGEHLPTEQLCGITCEGKNYYAVAAWK